MKPKFELDGDDDARASARLIDPDAFDASEQEFAASLEQPFVPAATHFVLNEDEQNEESPASAQEPDSFIPELRIAEPIAAPESKGDALPQDQGSWRNEVAAKMNKYRARRSPREPRYPSLQLKFEPYEPLPTNRAVTAESAPSANSTRQAFSLDSVAPAEEMPSLDPVEYVAPPPPVPETTGRILEFPRSLTFVPPQPLDELAEPVFDRPRILEVPETEPLPPALGGILIEPIEQPATERRPGFEVPLQSAPFSRRVAAVAMDALIVAVALSIFSGIFFRITATVPPLQRAAGTMAALAGLFWVAYQYLLLVYTGTTPGLKLAKLRLDQFDGSAVPRKVRRWRVLASALSGLSLGLGYAWCFLDEDELCWHDRITRTYMAPIK